MAEPQVRRWTLADLRTQPDYDGWIRYEIVDGELFESDVPGNEHQETCALTSAELGLWNRQASLGSVLVFPHLIFSDDDNTIPDVVWVSHARRAALEQADDKLHGAPELVVEVLSPGAENARRDREVKLGLYGRRGVDEYWLLDPPTRTVSVYRRREEELALVGVLDEAATLTSPVLPGFAAPVERLFPARKQRS
jgi:Uma2 family endonuclease